MAANLSSLLAGASQPGCADGIDASAQFNHPRGLLVDLQGRVIIADSHNHSIRAIDHFGTVTTLAGAASKPGHRDGALADAQFWYPSGCALQGDRLLVADTRNNCIRYIEASGQVSTLAGTTEAGVTNGPTGLATFAGPTDVAVGNDGVVLVADTDNHVIRRVDSALNVSSLCGGQQGFKDGTKAEASFDSPQGIAIDASGFGVVADTKNHCIRRVTQGGICTTIAGNGERGFADGVGSDARFSYPTSVAIDPDGNYIIADTGNNRIRQVTPQGVVSSILGSGAAGYEEGAGANAILHSPVGVGICPNGGFVFSDGWNHRVRYANHGSEQSRTRIPQTNVDLSEQTGENFGAGVERALHIIKAEVAKQMEVWPGGTPNDADLRESHNQATKALEKQRRELENAFLERSRELDAEIARRRAQCEKECKMIIAAQQTKVGAVLKALEEIGPNELVANANAQNEALKAQIATLHQQIEDSKADDNSSLGSLSAFFKWQDGEEPREESQPMCNPDELRANPAEVLRQLELKKQAKELADAKAQAIQAEDFIRADEIKEEIRTLHQRANAPPKRPLVTVTTLRVKQEHVKAFSTSWQEPPRTRLLQSHDDPAQFLMYEAHPSQADAQKIMETPDEVKWGDVATWLEEPTKTSCFDAVHMM